MRVYLTLLLGFALIYSGGTALASEWNAKDNVDVDVIYSEQGEAEAEILTPAPEGQKRKIKITPIYNKDGLAEIAPAGGAGQEHALRAAAQPMPLAQRIEVWSTKETE